MQNERSGSATTPMGALITTFVSFCSRWGWSVPASKRPAFPALTNGRVPGRAALRLQADRSEELGIDADVLPEILTGAQRFGFAGLNITHPCKQDVLPLLDELTPEAQALGAVNTVVLKEGRRVGHNTDWWGFAESFRRELPDVPRNRVVQFGAGGAGAAVAHALLTLGAGEVTIVDTDGERADRLVASLKQRFGVAGLRRQGPCGVVGRGRRHRQHDPARHGELSGYGNSRALAAAGIVGCRHRLFPLETELLREARARGCRTMSGGGMAVFQAVAAFRLFTGRDPDIARMLRHFAEM